MRAALTPGCPVARFRRAGEGVARKSNALHVAACLPLGASMAPGNDVIGRLMVRASWCAKFCNALSVLGSLFEFDTRGCVCPLCGRHLPRAVLWHAFSVRGARKLNGLLVAACLPLGAGMAPGVESPTFAFAKAGAPLQAWQPGAQTSVTHFQCLDRYSNLIPGAAFARFAGGTCPGLSCGTLSACGRSAISREGFGFSFRCVRVTGRCIRGSTPATSRSWGCDRRSLRRRALCRRGRRLRRRHLRDRRCSCLRP